ncbi:MAG: NUDIX hydrolase [Legionellales bacterium RIFCSPHIGHO2_12_FULL_37_14]|nr:MAG: NUDIX hydrolase [Legionellales bacterium RIFCSPHIGHO2_12_FULL_37_14]
MTDLQKALATIERAVENPKKGLPQEVFFFVSRLTPMINVDLLVKDSQNRALLSWRNNTYGRPGWHVPGGIIRYKETIVDRIQTVARLELGATVEFEQNPAAVKQVICSHDTRGHFISLLFRCRVPDIYQIDNKNLNENDEGFLRWHAKCPEQLLSVHEMYREYIEL